MNLYSRKETVYTTDNELDARAVARKLNDDGIFTMIQNVSDDAGAKYIVDVPKDSLIRAKAILEQKN